MSIMSRVRKYLDRDEPNYREAAAALGPQALPALHELVRGADPLTASKATYLASVIGSHEAEEVIASAAGHDDAVVRVAAAAAMPRLWKPHTMMAEAADASGGVLDRLLTDPDPGVRKYAVKAASRMNLQHRVDEAARSDPAEFVRDLAEERRRPER